MNVLVACEFSGTVRDAFEKKGWNAWSCDLLTTDSEQTKTSGKHHQGDVFEFIRTCGIKFDLLVGHPPCTYLSYAATRSWNDEGRVYNRLEALKFFADLWTLDIPHICIENPKGCASPTIAKYSQIIQPYYWGDPYYKTTCLWLKNLPMLTYEPIGSIFGATEVKPIGYHVDSGKAREKVRNNKIHKGMQPDDIVFGKNSKLERSRFWKGIANAMAEQWTEYLINKFRS
jgi:site-specific DNA-cytosine methylase